MCTAEHTSAEKGCFLLPIMFAHFHPQKWHSLCLLAFNLGQVQTITTILQKMCIDLHISYYIRNNFHTPFFKQLEDLQKTNDEHVRTFNI